MPDARAAEVVVERVSKTHGRGVQALVEVSMAVAPGEFVSITGPAGSGKSTLLHLIAGFERPDSGSIVVGDLVTASVRDVPRYRREVVGFVFQLHHLLPALTAQTNVELALLGGGMAAPERRERARLLLELVGVGHRAEHLPKELSGGERQCVAVARVVREPSSYPARRRADAALDQVAAGRILDLLDAIRAEERATVMAVSHDPAVAGRHHRRGRVGAVIPAAAADGRVPAEVPALVA